MHAEHPITDGRRSVVLILRQPFLHGGRGRDAQHGRKDETQTPNGWSEGQYLGRRRNGMGDRRATSGAAAAVGRGAPTSPAEEKMSEMIVGEVPGGTVGRPAGGVAGIRKTRDTCGEASARRRRTPCGPASERERRDRQKDLQASIWLGRQPVGESSRRRGKSFRRGLARAASRCYRRPRRPRRQGGPSGNRPCKEVASADSRRRAQPGSKVGGWTRHWLFRTADAGSLGGEVPRLGRQET